MKYTILLLLLIFEASANVVLVSVEGEITEGTYVTLKDAEDFALKNNAILLVELNTPGGLFSSTQKIVELFLKSRVPVVVYVPKGAICASAGTIILLSSDVAALANGTSIGASTPVSAVSGAAEEKVVKYIASYVKSIAEERKRNPEVAEKFVTEALSLTADEAYKFGVVDVLADSREELMKKINGKEFRGKKLEFNEKNTIVFEEPLNAKVFRLISNPQIAAILLLLGIYLLLFGLTSPGYIAETIGAICLVLALAGLGVIQSIDYLGILLILLGVVLLIAELLTPTYGFLGAASVVCTVLGLLLLIKDPTLPVKFYEDFQRLVLGLGFGFGSFMTFAIIKIAQSKRRRSKVGEMVEEKGEVIEFSGGKGYAKIRGEIWKIVSDDDLKKGDEVEVVDRDGLTLKVKKVVK
ncbi:MAG: nodulation protein NfeD [Archaeoglobaceae archaeon]|nr:nodulation protein NfeD [Archaeoglobaceae archaeon]MCX8152275.1 nodulation protein NfeD [Archaeoglobaceae archaeon]MDW8013953.1 nodulation protein NfeD [Archaeoglobaceae archaeon]